MQSAIIEGEYFATVHVDQMNSNNLVKYSPYRITELNGEPFVPHVRDPQIKVSAISIVNQIDHIFS